MFHLLFLLSLFLTGGAAGLGDDDFAAREAASARLTSWRLAALPCLWDAETSADPEVRRRAADAAEAILRPFPAARRVAPLWQAWRMVYEPGDCKPSCELDAWQTAELRDGGAALYLDILDVGAESDFCTYAECGAAERMIDRGEYNPMDARDRVLRLRLYARGQFVSEPP